MMKMMIILLLIDVGDVEFLRPPKIKSKFACKINRQLMRIL